MHNWFKSNAKYTGHYSQLGYVDYASDTWKNQTNQTNQFIHASHANHRGHAGHAGYVGYAGRASQVILRSLSSYSQQVGNAVYLMHASYSCYASQHNTDVTYVRIQKPLLGYQQQEVNAVYKSVTKIVQVMSVMSAM